jgi:HlyD family secretion protein
MVEQAKAGLAQAQWRVDQRHATAPVAALVSDTYARPGETINAGNPVVELLPPQNVLTRFFVPETELARLRVGDHLTISCDSCAPDLEATITFIAPQAEFTPPVIYSKESRAKLVFLVEAKPNASDAARLHPGQPVDVKLP